MLRHVDFAAYTPGRVRRGAQADGRPAARGRAAAVAPPAPDHRRGAGTPDLRRTVRRALRTGGEPIDRARSSSPATRPRRIVLLLDVSGSMEPYARAFVRFLHAAVVGRDRVEAFALGTRLTRITRELSSRDPDAAVARRGASASPTGPAAPGSARACARSTTTWGVRGHGARRDRRDPLRRLGPRRPRRARRADGAPRAGSRTRSSG